MAAVTKKTKERKKPSTRNRAKKGSTAGRKALIVLLALVLVSAFYHRQVLKSLTSAAFWVRDLGDPDYRTYQSFNIRIPVKYPVHGIDVSYYQGKIDWPQVKQMREDSVYIRFAFIKATEGIAQVDPYFQRNWREGQKAGLVCGAYHYFRPEYNGKQQAVFFLQTVKLQKGNLPPVADIEEMDGESAYRVRHGLEDFLEEVELQTKAKPIIYTNLKFYRDYLMGHFDGYTLWIAHNYEPGLDVGNAKWKFWQHSSNARVNGINAPVDFNFFNGDTLAFKRILVR